MRNGDAQIVPVSRRPAPVDRHRSRWPYPRLAGSRSGANRPHGKSAARTIAYGKDALQRLDVWTVPGSDAAPLVMFVHGSGSKDNASSRWLPAHLTQQGYAYASIDYRLVPAVAVEQRAEDVAHAQRALLDRAAEPGIDRRRVVLIGHSAGAHLVALVGTDRRHLKSAGLGFADLRGVIANDGAAYDVPAQLQEEAPMMHLRQRSCASAGALAHPPGRRAQCTGLFAAPRAASRRRAANRGTGPRAHRGGQRGRYGSFTGTGLRGHMEINRRLGDPGYPHGAGRWLAAEDPW